MKELSQKSGPPAGSLRGIQAILGTFSWDSRITFVLVLTQQLVKAEMKICFSPPSLAAPSSPSGAHALSDCFVCEWWMLKQAQRRGQESREWGRQAGTTVEMNLPCAERGSSRSASEQLPNTGRSESPPGDPLLPSLTIKGTVSGLPRVPLLVAVLL